MELVICDTPEEIASLAADRIEALIQAKPNAVLGTATGSSPLPLYDELARRCDEGRISFAGVTGFMLDEYVGLEEKHPERYANFMETNLRSRIDMPKGALQGPDALNVDPQAACREYEEKMAQAGYCDLQILGIGSDGHIGFNEPGGSLQSRTHLGVLTEQTRSDNARFFNDDIDAVPTHCITQGLYTIMQARQLLLIATGENKAKAIAQLIEGPISAAWPATIMQMHPEAVVFVDPAAASLLEHAGPEGWK
ncbi:glucosamine-6-phosphate deaminase [Actinomyces vulturis]|uniref:glucosamine-6-phosphate deaminase n=1 Tax=Actinomyces vulturis TaxID=1857645 RepID=UPI00083460E0|nr:glucosamine-6-phosphate deaminase [Actinomyces vulturis]